MTFSSSKIAVKITGVFVLCILFFFIFTVPVSAQQGTIYGWVLDDETNEPIVNASIRLTYSETRDVVATTNTDSQGYYMVTNLSAGHYIVKISAVKYIEESHPVEIKSDTFGGESVELSANLEPISLGGGDGDGEEAEALDKEGLSFAFFYQILLIITIALVVSLIMYSKIKRENMLKNAVRKRIFDYIIENPGMHYRGILNDLDLPMGVLTYHLNRLEKAQYIRSRQDGMYRRFYTKGPKTEMRFFLSDIQESILSVIKENQGISQSKIAEKIQVSRKVVNYHVNILDQAGLIFVESHGRESACYSGDTRIA
jgi:predicted transcriptional regulator